MITVVDVTRCTYCGKEYDDTATACVIDGQPVALVRPPELRAQESKPSVEFIRLFFKSQEEEEFAVRCARFIARVVGERVNLLRPDTTWSEIFQWLGPDVGHEAVFILLLREEFGSAYKEVASNYEFVTFRDFVEYGCRRDQRNI